MGALGRHAGGIADHVSQSFGRARGYASCKVEGDTPHATPLAGFS